MQQILMDDEQNISSGEIFDRSQKQTKEYVKYEHLHVSCCLPHQRVLPHKKYSNCCPLDQQQKNAQQLTLHQYNLSQHISQDPTQHRSLVSHRKIILFFDNNLILILKYLVIFQKLKLAGLFFNQSQGFIIGISVPLDEESFELTHGLYKEELQYLPQRQLSKYKRSKLSEHLYFEALKRRYFHTHSKILWRLPAELREPLLIERLAKRLEQNGITCIYYKQDALVLVNRTAEDSEEDEIGGDLVYKLVQSSRQRLQEVSIQGIKRILIELSFFEKIAQSSKEVEWWALLRSIIDTKQTYACQIQVASQQDIKIAIEFVHDHDFASFTQQAIAIYPSGISFQAHTTESILQLNFKDLEQIFQQLRLRGTYTVANTVQKQLYSGPSIGCANRALRSSSLLLFQEVWSQGLFEKVMSMIYNWEMYQRVEQNELIQLTLILCYKIRKYQYNSLSLFEKIYQRVSILADKLRRFLKLTQVDQVICKNVPYKNQKGMPAKEKQQVVKFKQALGIHMNPVCDRILDRLYEYYCKYQNNQDNKEKRELIVSIDKNDKFHKVQKFVAEKQQIFKYFSYLRNAISLLAFDHSLAGAEQMNSNAPKDQDKVNILQTIHQQRLVNTNCLGCATFVYHGMNILDEQINCSPLKIFRFIADMKSQEMEIKDYLCAMLNSCGGIMLFDCKRKLEKVVAKGTELTEKDKEEYEQRLMSYLQSFHPKEDAKKSVIVSFVPVRSIPKAREKRQLTTFTGQESLVKPQEQYRDHPYIPGMFIMRVKVSPVNPTTVFIWKESNNVELQDRFQRYTLSTLQQGKLTSLKMKQLSKQIKKRMKLYFMPSSINPEQTALCRRQATYFNHDCRKPEMGICKSTVYYRPIGSILKESYAYASMIVVNKNNFELVRRAFNHYRVDVKIEVLFEDLKLRFAQHTAIMYHNEKLQNLLRLVKDNPMFAFKNRPLLIIIITNYLKLSFRNQKNPYSRKDFENLLKWVNQRFVLQTMKAFMFKVDTNTKEYYLKCDTHEMTLFAFYILNQFNEKAVFKNPLHIDKMEDKELRLRLLELFPDIDQREQTTKHILEDSIASTLNQSN